MATVVKAVEEIARMRRTLSNSKSNQAQQKQAMNTCTRTKLSDRPLQNGGQTLGKLKVYNMLGAIVALLAILYVFLFIGDSDFNKTTNSTAVEQLYENNADGFAPRPRIVNYIAPENAAREKGIQSTQKVLVESIHQKLDALQDESDPSDDSFDEERVRLSDSIEYGKKTESMYSDDPPCEPQYAWQVQNNPACNLFHESDMTRFLLPTATKTEDSSKSVAVSKDAELFRFTASGGYRDVYMIRDPNSSGNKLALKTLRWTRDFTERHFDRHRRDAIVADRLMAIPTSVDIYGFCGQSALYEFAEGGDLKHAIQKHVTRLTTDRRITNNTIGNGTANTTPKSLDSAWNSTQKLNIAYQIAESLADVHNVDMEGRASVAHTDISTGQFISIKGDDVFKINDFNRGRLLRRNTENNTVCAFQVKSNKGRFRSPEEYLYQPETEKIDVYSMGNIFWVLLHGYYPFEKISRKATKRAVSRGQRPEFHESFIFNTDANIQALVEAAKMCWTQDPRDRASAREVQHFLQSKLK